jgi:hypothetical protein
MLLGFEIGQRWPEAVMHSCGSYFVSVPKGFWLELGAHTCYNSYRNLIGIIEDCQILDRLVQREKVPFRMRVGNQIKSIPSQRAPGMAH